LKKLVGIHKNIGRTSGNGSGPRGYTAGSYYSGYGYTGEKFPEGLSGNGAAVAYNNWALRQNGRNVYQDSTHAEIIAKRSADMIAGVGLKFFSQPDYKTLGITREAARETGDKITRLHHMYSTKKEQERTGKMNLFQAQRLYQICDTRDGENFIRLYYSRDRQRLINPVQFSFLDPNQIRGDDITDAYFPNSYYNGINYNSKGEETSYDIWIHTKNGVKTVTIPRIGEKSKRLFMLHCFAPEFAGQRRGLSRLGGGAQDYQNMEDFIQAHTQKAINESNIFMYAENQQQDPSNPVRDQTVPSSAGFAIPKTPAPSQSSTPVNPELICTRPVVPSLKPGSMAFFNLTQGDKLKPFPNTAPSDGFEDFLDTTFAYLSAKEGMPKSVAKMEFGQSYSASRGELLLYWIRVKVQRGEMVSDFLNPHLEAILSEEVAMGRLALPGWEDPFLRCAWLGGIWYGSSIPSLDPKKEADANLLNLKMSATTLDVVSRDLNGSTAEGNISENSRIFPMMPVLDIENKESSSSDDKSDDDEMEGKNG
jgi:capsid protein